VSARVRAAVGLLLVLVASASGCGTALNVYREFATTAAPPPEFYGGVRFEYNIITTPGEPPFDMRFLFLPFLLIDLPFSAVFDTLTLPWVAVRQAFAAQSTTGPETPNPSP